MRMPTVFKLLALCGSFIAASIAVPLRTEGQFILDTKGRRVKLACVNWYGAHMKHYAANGLSVQSEVDIAAKIVELGMNCVRLPYSTEAYVLNPTVKPEYVSAATAAASGPLFLDHLDGIVKALTDAGLMVILNNHNRDAIWCCSVTDDNGLWFNARYNESVWVESLAGLARRYRDNPLVVGYDLLNEPRLDQQQMLVPMWGDETGEFMGLRFRDLRAAYELAGAAVQAAAPDVLIIVAPPVVPGLCAWQLKKYPLRNLRNVVWTAHDYSWHGLTYVPELCQTELSNVAYVQTVLYHAMGILPDPTPNEWPADYSKFKATRDAAFGHLGQTAPFWLGEFGTDVEDQFWGWQMLYLNETDYGFGYWAVDGESYPSLAPVPKDGYGGNRPHDEIYGLLRSDYQTVRHEWKVEALRRLQQPRRGPTATAASALVPTATPMLTPTPILVSSVPRMCVPFASVKVVIAMGAMMLS